MYFLFDLSGALRAAGGASQSVQRALPADGMQIGSHTDEVCSSTPGGCLNPGPFLTPSTGDAIQPYSSHTAATFPAAVPACELATAGNSQNEAEVRTCSPNQVGQPAVPVAPPGLSTHGGQQPSSSGGSEPAKEPAASLEKSALPLFAGSCSRVVLGRS